MRRSRQRQNLAQKEGNTFFVKARYLRRNFSNFIPAILFFTAIAYKQNRSVAINETQTEILCLPVERARSKMLCAVIYIFNLLCAFNRLQPMKNSYFPLRPEPLVGYKLSRVALGTRMVSYLQADN